MNKELIKKFNNYAKSFNLKDINLMRKFHHTHRVCGYALDIAEDLKLNDKQTNIVFIIALLHDIGRFSQYTKYNTYKDIRSEDHGDLGYKVLTTNNYIEEYSKDNKEIILSCVKYHNKKVVPELDDETLFYLNIVKDADKMDIMLEQSNIIDDDMKDINLNIINSLYNKHLVDVKDIKCKADKVLLHLGFIFDINSNYALRFILDKKIIENKINILTNYTDYKEYDKLEEFLLLYIKSRINELEFDKYTSNYDMNDIRIKQKYNHSYRVKNLMKKYSSNLGYSNEDIYISSLIGLLHDIRRFEQLKKYNSYNDRTTIDHADYSVDKLFNDNLIKNYCLDDKYYNLVKIAIRNHNKYSIESIEDDRVLKFAKLIRDIDKLDIIYSFGYLNELNRKADDSEISKEVLESIKNKKTIDRILLKTKNDGSASFFAFVFDINNKEVLPELKENYKYFYNQLDGEGKFKEIFDLVNNYIDERIDKNVRN